MMPAGTNLDSMTKGKTRQDGPTLGHKKLAVDTKLGH